MNGSVFSLDRLFRLTFGQSVAQHQSEPQLP